MDIVLEKKNHSMFNVLPIGWNEDPVDSLSTININFESLDTVVCNLEYSATNIYNPLYNDFREASGSWDSVYDTINENSACWQGAYNTVRTLSAMWTSPISVIYPFPLTSVSPEIFTNWINSFFPVKTGTCINYLEGQEFFLFLLQYAEASQKLKLTCKKEMVDDAEDLKCISTPITYLPQGNDWGGYRWFCNKLFRCSAGKTVTIKDRYTKSIRGIKFVVEGETWSNMGLIY